MNRGWCHPYLLVDEDSFSEGKLVIDAYFTLSLKSLPTNNLMSKTLIKRISSFSSAASLQFALIGHLGKRAICNQEGTLEKAPISGKEILDDAFEVVKEVNDLVPCRFVLVECSSEQKVQDFYRNYGFKYIQKDGALHQFYRKI